MSKGIDICERQERAMHMWHNEQAQSGQNRNPDSFATMVSSLLTSQAFRFIDGTEQTPTLIQTHASAVILAHERVYKLKKPKNFGFFDYTTAELRRHFCQQEVALNAPLAPHIYLGIALIIQLTPTTFCFGPTCTLETIPDPGTSCCGGKVVDYAVIMVRLPEEATLFSLLQRGQVTPDLMQEIAHVIAQFHTAALTNSDIEPFGHPEVIRQNCEENFRQIQPYIGRTLNAAMYTAIVNFTRHAMEQHMDLFLQRCTRGYIRDCHGDLRLQHVYVLPDEPPSHRRIILLDRIEFNERFRYGDSASEIAFLVMELDFWHRQDLSCAFITHYIAETHDTSLLEVLPFYTCYRACVRGKVTSFILEETEITQLQREHAQEEATELFKLATSYAAPRPTPIIIMVGGLMGTGKSTLATALQKQLGWALFSSDVVRKQLAHIATTAPQKADFGEGIYSASWTTQTYKALCDEAGQCLQSRISVILDATFSRRTHRQNVAQQALDTGAKILFIECVCPREVALQRLAQRWRKREENPQTLQGQPSIASDGHPDLYDAQCAAWEAFDPKQESTIFHLVLPTTASVPSLLARINTALTYLKTSKREVL